MALSRNIIDDLEPLRNSTYHYLSLRYNELSDISPIESMKFHTLLLSNNKIKTIKPLLRNKYLEMARNLQLYGNEIPSDEIYKLISIQGLRVN